MSLYGCWNSPIFSRVRTRSLYGTLFLLLLLSPAFSQTSAPDLIFDPLNVRQDGVVEFTVLFVGTESRTDFPEKEFTPGNTSDHAFRLYLDVGSLQQIRFNTFAFTAYLVNTKGPAGVVYKYQVAGNPTGSFQDTSRRETFHVKAGSVLLTGFIEMSVYNANKPDQLRVEKQEMPAHVSVSGTTQVQIQLENAAEALPVSVTDVAFTENCPKCWIQVTSPVNEKSTLLIASEGHATLLMTLSPSTIPALLQGVLVLKPDAPHDTLSVTLTYHSDPGGADRKQTIPVAVRFGPGLFGLGLAVCAGIALGLTARYLLTGKLGTDNERPLHAILTALVFGIIAEFVGILLTAYGSSKLILLGLDIDPSQLFPAFILAMLVSGGSAVVSWIKDLLGKAK